MSRSRFSKLVSVVITGVIAISGLPSMVLADVINSPTYYSVQSELDYEITTNITSSWSNHESIDLVLTNTGSDTIHNWYLTFNTPYNIENIWNGTIYETDGNGTYTITSNGWNQDIHTGEFVTVGITFSSDTETELSINPEWYLLNTQATVVDASQYTLEYTEYSAWETGFTGQLTLTPQVDCQHWELSFSSNREITAVSSAVLIPEGDNNYAITHDENNMRLFASNAYNFGIQGSDSCDSLELTDVELTVVDLAYSLTDDVDGNGMPDYLDFMGGGSIVGPTPTPIEEPTITPTAEPTITELPTDTPTGEPTETPTPTPLIDYESDRDLDGLTDYIEEQIGTDPLKDDTDDDGLSDYIEVMIGYDPINIDSDGNGITDDNEDLDGDDLSNLTELIIGTEITTSDTDLDTLLDGDEVNIFGTSPILYDSDSDGLSDGEELTIGKNPLDQSDGSIKVMQTLSTPITNAEDPSLTSVDISLATEGDIFYVAYAEDLYNIDIMSTDVYGRIGSPISFECNETFDSATVVFHYDDAMLGNTSEANLGVLWYDELEGIYVIQEQAVVDTTSNTITITLNHFSTYVVVDLEMWNNPIVPDYSNYIQIASESDEYWEWGGRVPTVEEREIGCFNWWKLSHPFQQFQIVETLLSNRYCENPNSGVRFWHYEYSWLVMDMTDNDEDGVSDFLEQQGIIGPNRCIYYSNPTLQDTDSDGLTDGEEFGDIYYFVNYEGNLITNSTANQGYYYPSESGKSVVYARLRSYADKANSDFDTQNDAVDSFPLVYQQDIIYILYQDDHLNINDASNSVDARLFYRTYRNCGNRCILVGFNGADSFIDSWGRMGRYNYANDLYTSDDFYNITDVVLVAHGSFNGMHLGNGDTILLQEYGSNVAQEYVSVNDLEDKMIQSLHLRVCVAGAMTYDDNFEINSYTTNMATDFLSLLSGVEEVYAFDCVCTVRHHGDGTYSLLGLTSGTLAYLPIYLGDSTIIMDDIGVRIHQQCRFFRNESETDHTFTVVNGYYICYEECYLDDWYIQASDYWGRVYTRFSESQSSFDPILLG